MKMRNCLNWSLMHSINKSKNSSCVTKYYVAHQSTVTFILHTEKKGRNYRKKFWCHVASVFSYIITVMLCKINAKYAVKFKTECIILRQNILTTWVPEYFAIIFSFFTHRSVFKYQSPFFISIKLLRLH